MAYSLTSARSDCLRAGLDRCGSRWRLGSPSARRWFIAVSVPDDISRRLILEELAGPPCGASATAACTIFSSACAAAMVAMECALPACVPAAFANRPSVPFILVLPRHAMRARRGPAWCLVEVCHWSSLMVSMCFPCPVTMCNMVRSLKSVLITGTRPTLSLKRAQHATRATRHTRHATRSHTPPHAKARLLLDHSAATHAAMPVCDQDGRVTRSRGLSGASNGPPDTSPRRRQRSARGRSEAAIERSRAPHAPHAARLLAAARP